MGEPLSPQDKVHASAGIGNGPAGSAQPPGRGLGPWTVVLSRKQYPHSSPASAEVMSGWLLSWWWDRAWRPGEESQQPTFPHSRQIRRCTQFWPWRWHSTHPSERGSTGRDDVPCGQPSAAGQR